MTLTATNKKFITLPEIAAGVFISLIILVVGFVVLRPDQVYKELLLAQGESQLQTIVEAFTLYSTQNDVPIPTYEGGNPLPTVTEESLIEKGIPIDSIDNFIGEYLSQKPDHYEYLVGVSSNGKIIVGTKVANQQITLSTE